MSEHECGCPEWVVMCCHHNGELLRLTDWQIARRSHYPRCQGKSITQPFHISSISEGVPYSRCSGCGAPESMYFVSQLTDFCTFETIAEALVAFHAEESRIRQEVFGR